MLGVWLTSHWQLSAAAALRPSLSKVLGPRISRQGLARTVDSTVLARLLRRQKTAEVTHLGASLLCFWQA